MPVDKFGRTQIGETPSTAEGVSLSYVARNFQRKGDVDAATKNYVVSTIDRIMGDFIQNAGYGDIVTKSYVDEQVRNRKPVITVFAEENGPMQNNQYEWSFGNGADGSRHANCGYVMLGAGRLLRMGIASSSTSSMARVNIVVNGTENTSYSVERTRGAHSGTVVFTTPLEMSRGDRINLISAVTNSTIPCAVVSLLIELDL